MSNLERIEIQKKEQEIIQKLVSLNTTAYSSGRVINDGDCVLLGMLREDSELSIITFNEAEYGTLYTDDPQYTHSEGKYNVLRLIKKPIL
jgi:hypothetical protein